MITKQAGTSGIQVSVIAQGTWSMGGDAQWGNADII